ncbi:MAG: diguanylate cyclase [Ectothiorhodospiraceae bacterium]|nr:diguanylate cyclase [Ectothiorhodospiraceae bacterium]
MIVDYTESVEEATQIARVALPLANKYALPANPVNYAVLYEYVAGQNSELNAVLDQLREAKKELTSDQLQALYQRFVDSGDEQVINNVRQALAGIMASTIGSLDKVEQESQSYQASLGDAANQLASGKGAESPVDVIAKLIEETLRMQETSKTLQDELEKTNKDLMQLRTDYKRVRQESLIDPLTGIQNRRAFDESLSENCTQAGASHQPLCLLLVDIDFFKKVNDTHGHVVGDAVLKQVANVINDTVRGGDVLARYGGEEFAVLLPNTPMDGAERVADNICNIVRNCSMNQLSVGAEIGRITVSVGVAQFHSSESGEAFVVRSDTALYRAKESGRNRVCTHTFEAKVEQAVDV